MQQRAARKTLHPARAFSETRLGKKTGNKRSAATRACRTNATREDTKQQYCSSSSQVHQPLVCEDVRPLAPPPSRLSPLAWRKSCSAGRSTLSWPIDSESRSMAAGLLGKAEARPAPPWAWSTLACHRRRKSCDCRLRWSAVRCVRRGDGINMQGTTESHRSRWCLSHD